MKKLTGGLILKWRVGLSECNSSSCIYPNCTFIGNSIKVLMEHHHACPLIPEPSYTCRICKMTFNDQSNIKSHIQTSHDAELNQRDFEGSGSEHSMSQSSSENDDDDDDEESGVDENEEDESVSEVDENDLLDDYSDDERVEPKSRNKSSRKKKVIGKENVSVVEGDSSRPSHLCSTSKCTFSLKIQLY